MKSRRQLAMRALRRRQEAVQDRWQEKFESTNTDNFHRALQRRQEALQDRWQEKFESTNTDNFHQKSCRCSACRTPSTQESPEGEISTQLNSGFPDEILVSSTFGDTTKDYVNWPNNDTLTYTIFDRNRNTSLYTANSHSDTEEAFIHNTIDEVDSSIELDFDYSQRISDSEVVFVSVDRYRPWGSGDSVAGQVVQTKNRWFVLWRDNTPNSDELIDYDKNTITHELGHALGLSHPAERPNIPRFNTVEDTIMSYNDYNGQWGTKFTDNDYDALEMIWGTETMNVLI